MKRIYYIIFLLILPLYIVAQSTDQNYILTRTYQSSDGTSYLDQIQYFDGLGHPLQTVEKGITPSGKDLVNQIEYDADGREYRNWLPAPATGSTGAYVTPTNFTSLANTQYLNDADPYAETILESSPLSRVIGQKKPGSVWNVHPTSVSYQTNASEVAYFSINSSNQLQRNGSFTANTVYKTQTTDEDGKIAIEYTNKLGQVVMKRSSTNVDTYYVYNDMGRLSYVLPPIAADSLPTTGTITDDNGVLKRYAYLYKYDERGNNIVKRLPGCDSICMVYDKANRLVLSQDGNQRAKLVKQWTVIKYDIFGRVIYTGYRNGNETRAQLKAILDPLVITESYVGTNGFNTTGYSCGYFINEITPLTVNYYDDYSFTSLTTNGSNLNWVTPPTGYDPQYTNSKGLLTGTRTYILDKTIINYLTTAMYYDNRGRVVQTRASNHLSGYDNVYNHYDFNGRVLTCRKEHNSSVLSLIYEVYANTYDKAGRPLITTYAFNCPTPITLSNNMYDELGRLTTKLRHNNTDTLKYTYNIRNWATMLKSSGFIENLYYNTNPGVGAICLNGNISFSTWTYNGSVNKYGYNYDDLNRLASTTSYNSSNQPGGAFTETFTLDKMGNLKNLGRMGATSPLDALTLTYTGNQLKKVDDWFPSQNQYSIKEYNNWANAPIEFIYDQNGNMTTDLDRNIVTIRYNILNLPDTIQFSTGNQIVNRYAADGRKLGTEYFTRVTNLAVPLITGQLISQSYLPGTINQNGTAYIDNKEYNTFNGNPSVTMINLVHNNEGYVSLSTSYTGFIYNRTDHLGNIREIWSGTSNKTIQRTQYYASGLPWATTPADNLSLQPYKFNGNEFIEMNGYDGLNYWARTYFPDRTGWGGLDRLAENTPGISPYAFCYDNPVRFIDPLGLEGDDSGQKDIYNRNRFDSFTNMYITPLDRPGGIGAFGFGNLNFGHYEDKYNTFYNSNSYTIGGNTYYNFYTQQSFAGTQFIWDSPQDKMYGMPNKGQFFNSMNNFTSMVGLVSDGYKVTGLLGSVGVLKTIATLPQTGYVLIGLSTVANLGLFFTHDPNTGQRNQSLFNTGLNIGIGAIMLRMPLQISIGYGIGSIMYNMQQSSFKTLINQGYGDNPMLFNTDWLK